MELDHVEPSLCEALRHIGDWQADIAALFSSDDRSPWPPLPLPPTLSPSTDPDWVPAQECGEQFELLNQTQPGPELHFDPPPSAGLSNDENDAIQREWEEMAARQREQRYAAEVENHKLRELVEAEQNASRRLSALMTRARAIETALGSSPDVLVTNYEGPRVDSLEHVARLDALEWEAQALFASDRFARRVFRDVEFHNLGEQGSQIELTASWELPFGRDSIVEALWIQTTRLPRKEKETKFEDVYTAERTLVSRFVSEPTTPGTIDAEYQQPARGSSHGQVASRCGVPMADGSVLVVSNMNVKNFKPDGSGRSLMQGNGFLLVIPMATHDAGKPLCRVMWCRRMQGSPPDTSEEAAAEHSKWANMFTTGAMQKQWLSSIEQNLQAVENTLFDTTLGQRGCSRV